MFRKIAFLLIAGVAGIYLYNASWFKYEQYTGSVKFVAHRGVHQNFHRENLTNETCTAARINKPTHIYLENTIASMQAAFDAGATVVELDVHPTTDGKLAVFHDWTVDCRTEGTGETRSHSMAALKELDIGYGYTADNGKTFPFRKLGVEEMPELEEVFRAFPEQSFLIHFKEKETRPAELLLAKLARNPEWKSQVWAVYGAPKPTRYISKHTTGLVGFNKQQTKTCIKEYVALGWVGYVPEACRRTIITVPSNYAWVIWGGLRKFERRLNAYNSKVILAGPYNSQGSGGGIDTEVHLDAIPKGFGGYIWTNKMEQMGPQWQLSH